jgi:hypothetical protein
MSLDFKEHTWEFALLPRIEIVTERLWQLKPSQTGLLHVSGFALSRHNLEKIPC